jgi:hypothetical protein
MGPALSRRADKAAYKAWLAGKAPTPPGMTFHPPGSEPAPTLPPPPSARSLQTPLRRIVMPDATTTEPGQDQ